MLTIIVVPLKRDLKKKIDGSLSMKFCLALIVIKNKQKSYPIIEIGEGHGECSLGIFFFSH